MSCNRKNEKKFTENNSLSCKPLDTYSEIMLFLENPPPWRTLCKELTPHSNLLVRNIEINNLAKIQKFDLPEYFCHFEPDTEEIVRHEEKKLPKTLVCHDMANGYHDDCVIDGTDNYEGYTFYNWAGIDIFCYFSHHLITIPPLGWINIGHAHGVKVIGTIITEWADGIDFWDQVLVSESEYQKLATALVAIAKTLKFDGYLLNVENKIAKPDVLLEFVRYFHQLLHQELENAVLIWYDSVTIEGNLNWQNKLNDKNKPFFDACDGFFTNYSWTLADVTESAVTAAERITDLYIGIDVWGRNFYGGGQFNTQEAIKVVQYSGCSMAVFAPAWSHEALSMDKNDPNSVAMADDLDKFSQALLRDRALWDSFWPFLNTRIPCQMPFQTSFCRGLGKKRCLYGEVLSPSPWYNLRHQQYQPNAMHGPHCYVLTTFENIAKVRAGNYKDKKGIIRYHTSFYESRQDFPESHLRIHHASVASLSKNPSESLHKVTDVVVPAKVKKVTMKDTLINLFKHKNANTSDEERTKPTVVEIKEEVTIHVHEDNIKDESAVDIEESPVGPSTSAMFVRSSGRSMQQMSVNLQLGTSAEKLRFCLGWVPEEQECLELYLDDCFNGGACLKVNPSDTINTDHRYTRLFYCDFKCEDTLVVCVVTKTLAMFPEQSLNLHLFMKNSANHDLKVMLTGRELAYTTQLERSSPGIKYVYPVSPSEEQDFKELRAYLLLNEPSFYVPVENSFGWTVRYYQITVPSSRVTSINVRTTMPSGGILLGYLGLCHRILPSKADLPVVPEKCKEQDVSYIQ